MSLLEVLFAMGILLIGLLGVGAMIPAGRFEVLQGAKIDHASMIGRQAFRDLKMRGYLNPANWTTFNGSSYGVYTAASGGTPASFYNATVTVANSNGNYTGFTQNTWVTPAVTIDPLGATAASASNTTFPNSATAPLALTRIIPYSLASGVTVNYQNLTTVADPVFRSGDDLLFTASTQGKDFPPTQQWFGSNAKRGSNGDYSWLATVVTDPATTPQANAATSQALNGKVTVSVAVFYKRDLSAVGAGENIASVTSMPGNGIGGGEAQITYSTSPINPMKPGQWVMLAGTVTITNPTTPPPAPTAGATAKWSYFRWYRVVAADVVTSSLTQNVTLAGPDWNTNATTQAWLFDNVIAVFEKNLKLEIQ